MNQFLDDKVHTRIVSLAREGDALLQQECATEAIAKYVQALKLLPKPIEKWEAATWLFTAIGDAYWLKMDFTRSLKAFHSALRSPGGVGNPFIHLRLGQLQVELNNSEKAIDNLLRAYMGADRQIFEAEDPKYFRMIENLI